MLIVIIFSLLFYFDFTSRSAAGQERIVGSISFKKQIAQRKYSDQVVWDEIEQSAPVYNNDSLRTADNSEAVVRLTDGTEITVNENSMIQLSFTTDEIDIQFKGGSISTRRGDVSGEIVSNIKIKTDETTVNVTKSDVQLSGAEDKGVNLIVTRGDATVTAGGKEKSVKENQKVVFEKGSKDVLIYTLPLRLLKPLPDSVLVTTGIAGDVTFSWGTIQPEQVGTLEISDSPQFGRIIAARKISGDALKVHVPSGTFYWRLRTKNRATGAVMSSDARKFSLVRVEPAHLIYPDHGQTIQYGKNRPVINFKWSSNGIAQEYRLEIAADPAMEKVTGTYRTSGTSMAVDILGAGTYYWRIISVMNVSGSTTQVPGSVRMMKISKKTRIDPPMPQYPPDGGIVSGMLLKENGIVFSWMSTEDIQAAQLVITSKPDFSTIRYSGTSGSNFLNIRKNLEPGTYYWKVLGVLSGNIYTAPSQVMKFSVLAGENIILKYPANGSELVPSGSGKDIRLSWEKTGMYGEYLVQVSSNKSFARIDREDHVAGDHAVVSGIIPGTYYWRVMLKNNDGSTVMMSKTYYFTILDTLPEPAIISPVNRMTIDMDKLNELDLRWKRLEEANAYRFRLYRILDKKPTIITDRMIRGTTYDLADINLPGEGEYLWSVQAFVMNSDGSKIIRKSPVSQSHFTIQAAAIPRKIKIITPKVIYVE